MGRTHAMGGVASLWLLLPFERAIAPEAVAASVASGMPLGTASSFGLLCLFAVLGALLPDLDAPRSLLSTFSVGSRRENVQPFALPALVLHRALGHRGFLHSLAGLVLVTVLLSLPIGLWLGNAFGYALAAQAFVALVLGYASHLALDACTRTGVLLLYPDKTRRFFLPPPWRITTGSLAEEGVFVLLAVASFVLVLALLYPSPGGNNPILA